MAIARLIKDADMLEQYIPNVITSVKGEKSLFDKLDKWLLLAEAWLKDTFTSDATFAAIASYSDDNIVKPMAARAVVCEAMRMAVPSLDVVLTPNGFGIVSNSNIAPASKERVARLIDSLVAMRDEALALLITKLPGASKWLTSVQCAWFRSTLFPSLEVVGECGFTENIWDKYVKLRSEIIGIEESLAEEYFSREQMYEWRINTPSTDPVLPLVKMEIVSVLKGNPINSRRMVECVNYIRNNPEKYPKWHASDTAKLFSPPKFENKKEAKGYWF
ncbi:MAG: hypothetical protein Q4B68_10620 [Bacteroidales bacterium]|nr:hypothetical protein [Bacteroidales bacterium]